MSDYEILEPIDKAAWEEQHGVIFAITQCRRRLNAYRYIKACCDSGCISDERYMKHKSSTLPRLDAYFADFNYAATRFIQIHVDKYLQTDYS